MNMKLKDFCSGKVDQGKDMGDQHTTQNAARRDAAGRLVRPQHSFRCNMISQAYAASIARIHEQNEYEFPDGLLPTSEI